MSQTEALVELGLGMTNARLASQPSTGSAMEEDDKLPVDDDDLEEEEEFEEDPNKETVNEEEEEAIKINEEGDEAIQNDEEVKGLVAYNDARTDLLASAYKKQKHLDDDPDFDLEGEC